MLDVIVVGARCAGAATAMLLARKGHRVLLVDRATFPSDIPHGHFIHRHGPRRLQQWGLLDRIVATNCPAVTSMTIDADDFPLTGRGLAVDGVALGYGPRRVALDRVLVEAAVEAGAELRDAFAVEEFIAEDGRVVGIRGRSRREGGSAAERATVVVGADGRHSRLARAVGARAYETTPPLTCWYWSYWSDVPPDGLEVYVRGRSVTLVFPTNHDLTAVFIAWDVAELPAVRADLERAFMAVVDRIPPLAARVRGGRRVERFYGATDVPNFLRAPAGPGWALVGDAGCHKDPYLALGICDALRDAELLAEALDEGLSGRRPLDAALADYEPRRNAASLDDYQQNLQMAQFRPMPTETRRLRAALRGHQEETNRFFLAYEGMTPRAAFFNPENLARVVARGGAS
ncbi:MAG TPA: NAD(P)/FAD-dependent oxidoreductase [Gemmatimonadaceae bacterium]|nr:NAD(P)/FAD-dependent oxidoreductase [Gemmatimonadaceae bacterium]